MRYKVGLAVFLCAAFIASALPLPTLAGTTGGITGRIVDSTTQAPVASAAITITSPSQSVTTATDADGTYRFLSLAPDAYTISVNKTGFTPFSYPGVSVFADQVQTVNLSITPALKTIANVTARSSDIVKPGTTSDIYSVNAAGAAAAQALIGPGGLNNAYGAIASVPGVAIDPGEQGWFQTVHIRGGDIDQIGYEVDGIPVNRVYDNAPQTMLSSLGQQELQVYTGGTPASADAQGISGFINQVVKTGTYPGFAELSGGIGTPAFYHKASVEAGGSNPSRTFSYYVGLGAANQNYRYIDNDNGGPVSGSFFYPVNAVPGNNGFVYTGDCSYYVGCAGPAPIDPTNSLLFASGTAYGLAYTAQRDNIVNLHFAVPHASGNGLRDDFQVLWMTSEVQAQYYSSPNDLNPAIAGCACTFGPLYWDDAYLYQGSMMQALDPSKLAQYPFNSSPPHDFNNTFLPLDQRDTNDNGVAIAKIQYQHAFSSSAFARIYGYSLYSNWFIYGPNSASQPLYGAELADYEIPNHTAGVNVSLTDQISSQHLLTASAVYTATNLQRYSAGYFTGSSSSRPIALLTDSAQNCYDKSGNQVGCYWAVSNGDALGGSAIYNGNIPAPPPGTQWTAVDRGLKANLNQVKPRFSGLSLSDQWRPNDRLNVNLGLRVENFRYLLGDTSPNDPARQFWFNAYNNEFCTLNGGTPFGRAGTSGTLQPCASIVPGSVQLSSSPATMLFDQSGGQIDTARWQPRFGFTYTLNADTVLRGSAGVYARPQNSSWVQYNTVQEDLASFLGNHFYSYGFHTPEHDIRPDTSYNYDVSLEKRLHGTDWSFKLTPFLRSTRDQLQNFFIDPLTGLESGLNVGHQVSYGVEFALRKGDFNNQGWSGQLSYTYTHSRIKYQNFPNSNRNVIDNLNSYIQDYNNYTSACANNPSSSPSSPCYYASGGTSLTTGAAAAPCYTASGAPDFSCAAGSVTNPYWNATPQPLLDRNAYYTTYDVIPGPVSAENGYETPHVATLILNYRNGRFAITPSVNFNSGASYGAPLAWPGYRPETCPAQLTAGAVAQPADPVSCTDAGILPVFIPDKYTGQFDALGQFKQPWRVSLNVNLSYDLSKAVTADLLLTNIVDSCGQRGYAWDNANTCVYGNLPSGILYPAGNFFPNSLYSAPPAQLQYPYSFWLNNNNTGFVGTKIPFQATFNVHVKL
jgi:hypothetical protein